MTGVSLRRTRKRLESHSGNWNSSPPQGFVKGAFEERDRVTGNLVGAAFLHTTSRALDPQLHTHFVLFNCTWDKTEQRWKALQTGDMFGAINYGTAVYRNELAKRLHQLGYSTRRTGNGF